MADKFAEGAAVSALAPLRQGDVLEHKDPSASMWVRHLFVITADCDLANHKHQGRITCVPLLTADEYLVALHLPKQRQALTKRFINELQTEISRHGSWRISDSRLTEWVLEAADPTHISQALSLDTASAARIERLAEGIRLAHTEEPTFERAAGALINAQLLLPHAAPRENYASRLRSTVTSLFKQQPGDALFVSSIAPGHEAGYFAYLRQIEQVWEPEVALAAERTSRPYHRIARMPDRYAHALVQQFAMVFMPIGLPAAYEASRTEHARHFEGVIA